MAVQPCAAGPDCVAARCRRGRPRCALRAGHRAGADRDGGRLLPSLTCGIISTVPHGRWPCEAIAVFSAAVVVFAFLILETRRASRNERAQRARGGIEPSGDVYPLMQIAYPGAFAAMLLE